MKLPDNHCTSQWKKGVVTRVQSPNEISVNRVPQHVLDIQWRVIFWSDDDANDEEQIGKNESQ